MTDVSPRTRRMLLRAQRNEINAHHVYRRLARMARSATNREVLERIAADELRHARMWRDRSGLEVKPDWLLVYGFAALVRVLGITFGIKLLEIAEARAQIDYDALVAAVPEAREVLTEEADHEKVLFEMLDDSVLANVGSIVLGLNDALVELTGALAGLSFAFQNTQLVALSGLVTGIAASFSMAASEYLSRRAEDAAGAGKSALFTGVAYIVTVAVLVAPFLIVDDHRVALAATLTVAVLIVAVFTFYLSVARGLPFRRRFLEMAGISLGVAAVSFGIGIGIKHLLGVEI
ncbi:rubrerythrin family protein [bacterium]|nr:rubrerythrin family protein [bacterium]